MNSDNRSSFKVLFLDDDDQTRTLASKGLARIGFSVDAVGTPAEVDESKLSSYSLFITDYRLAGGLSGLDVIRSFRKRGLRGATILITGYGDESILLEALRTGVHDFVHKNSIFFDTLEHVVRRIADLEQSERELAQARKWVDAFQSVGPVLEAAGVDYWQIPRDGVGEIVLPKSLCSNLGLEHYSAVRLERLVEPAELRRLLREIALAKRSKIGFELLFKIKIPESGFQRWVKVRGTSDNLSKNGRRLYGIVWDDTDSATNAQKLAESLNQQADLLARLRFSMIETHHRVKNGFQLVRSLLNMELRGKNQLDKSSVDKVLSHLSGLAMVHDLLTEQVQRDEKNVTLKAGELIERITSNIVSDRGASTTCDDISLSPRVASSLAVISGELLMNAVKYGGKVLEVEVKSGDRGLLLIRNDAANPESVELPGPGKKGTGLQLIEFLAKVDFGSAIGWSITSEGFIQAAISFPIEKTL